MTRGLTGEERDRAVDDFIELVAAVDGMLRARCAKSRPRAFWGRVSFSTDGSKHRRVLQRRIRIVPAVRRARSSFEGMYCNPRRHTIGPLLPRPRPVFGPVPDR